MKGEGWLERACETGTLSSSFTGRRHFKATQEPSCPVNCKSPGEGFHAMTLLQTYQLQNCQDPSSFPNGDIINSDYSAGQSITFQCYSGYVLIGHPVLTCLHGSNRKWNHPFPRCEAPCGYNVSAENGTIYSPQYPNEYPNSQDCSWLITVPHGHGVYINFTLLQTEPVTDYIAVW
ncbi:CUB and sushi domain-containing protein 1 [Takifugu flavidus]|uniref:CUB and sushi domain-containing protein 1 n=1 Tax=Takifugu flavidus TaxID=433684 RepID=A0A5C6NNI7_9TELE|nr:CUB and sushi domain-containing protein 1 [Takifugu flavidus]